MGRNKQREKCTLTTKALRAHGGSGRLEVVRIFMSAVWEAALTTQAPHAPVDISPSGSRATLIVRKRKRRSAFGHTYKSSGRKGAPNELLRSSGNCNQTLRPLSEKLILATVARKGFALELRLSKKQQNRWERSCGMKYDATGRNSENLFIGQNDPA